MVEAPMILAGWPRIRVWLLAAIGLSLLFLPGWWRVWQLSRRAQQLDGEIAALETENRRLLAEMQRLQDDPVYLERVARKKLGLTRKGEVIYKVDTSPAGEPPQPH